MNRTRFAGKGHAFSQIELLAIISVVVTLAVVALIFFCRSHFRASRIGCVNQLKNIGLAYRVLAADHNGDFPFRLSPANDGTIGFENDIVRQFLALTNELSTPSVLVCPARAFGRPRNSYWGATEAKS
jgi:hypothetical protein